MKLILSYNSMGTCKCMSNGERAWIDEHYSFNHAYLFSIFYVPDLLFIDLFLREYINDAVPLAPSTLYQKK